MAYKILTGFSAAMLTLATSLTGPAFAEDVQIGAVVPITGTFAASGIQYYNSLQLAQDDINAAGGINGNDIKIVFEDTQSSNSTAVNAFVKLTQQVKPPLIMLSSMSTQNLATEPDVTKAGIPVLYAGGLVAVQEKKNPMMFRIRPPDSLLGAAIAKGFDEVLKLKKPGILYMQDDYGAGASGAIEAELAKRGITPVAKETFSPKDNDFSAQLLSLKNAGADAIICITYNRDGALILKQRRSMGITLPFLCGSAMIAPSTLELVEPGDLENLYAVGDTVLGAGVSPASADFVARYKERFGFKPDPFGAAYYDAAMMVADALRKNGSDPAKLQEYFASLKDFQGVARTYSNKGDGTNNLAHSVVLTKYVSGTKDLEALATLP